jgi:hypothetical protein
MSADFPSCQLSHFAAFDLAALPTWPDRKRQGKRLDQHHLCVHLSASLSPQSQIPSPPTTSSTSHIHPPPPPSVLHQRSNVIISHVTAPLDQTLSSKRAPFAIHHRSHASSTPHSSLPPLEHVLLGGQRSRKDQAASQGKSSASLHNLARPGAYFATFHNIHMLVTAYIAR